MPDQIISCLNLKSSLTLNLPSSKLDPEEEFKSKLGGENELERRGSEPIQEKF